MNGTLTHSLGSLGSPNISWREPYGLIMGRMGSTVSLVGGFSKNPSSPPPNAHCVDLLVNHSSGSLVGLLAATTNLLDSIS